MPTPKKEAEVQEISALLKESPLAILTDYRGLDVSGLQGLRATLRPLNAEFKIAKNTLTRIASEKAGIEGLTPMLEGPLALVLAYEDVVAPSKAVSDFARTSRILTIKGGVLENSIVSSSDIENLATLPSREELLGKLLGLINSPIQGLVNVLSGPSRSFVQVLNAYAEKQGGGAESAA